MFVWLILYELELNILVLLQGTFKLTIEPKDKVAFDCTRTGSGKVVLKLTNSADKRRAFKVKCTNNTVFRIRPAVGKLEPSASTTVTLSYTPEKDKPTGMCAGFYV